MIINLKTRLITQFFFRFLLVIGCCNLFFAKTSLNNIEILPNQIGKKPSRLHNKPKPNKPKPYKLERNQVDYTIKPKPYKHGKNDIHN